MSKRKTRIGLKYAIGGKRGIKSLDDALYRIVRGISDTTFYECHHEWSFEEIVHEMTIHIEKGNDNYDYTIYCYIDTNSYIGDLAGTKWEKGAYKCRTINGYRIYTPSKDFQMFYDEFVDRQIRTLKDGVFTSPPVYDFILSLFKDVMYEDMEDFEIKTKYNAIVDAVKKVLCGKEKEVVIEGDDDLPWEDPFFH